MKHVPMVCKHDANCPFIKQLNEDYITNDEIRRGARWALAKEIYETLQSRGYWVPKITADEDTYSDLILAVGLAVDKSKYSDL